MLISVISVMFDFFNARMTEGETPPAPILKAFFLRALLSIIFLK